MDTPLTGPMAIAMANQFFDDLIALTDEHHALAQLLPTINDFRYETLNYPDMLRTACHMRGFLLGLRVAELLTGDQMNAMNQRLERSHNAGWL